MTVAILNFPTIISGNTDVGSCCGCDTTDSGGVKKHILQYTLFLCGNPGCNHYVCRKHLESCGYCEGCCAEEHGLGSHILFPEGCDGSSTSNCN